MANIFSFKSVEDQARFKKLIEATDGSEPCFDPLWDSEVVHESPTNAFVEQWSGRHTVSKAEAEAMCGDCRALELCADYAMKAKEPFGIWGGTRPVDRGIKPKFKG